MLTCLLQRPKAKINIVTRRNARQTKFSTNILLRILFNAL